MTYANRREAGERLAQLPILRRLVGPNTIALGLTRGGVAVAAALAEHLGIPLDAIIVKKIGAPGNPEYAIGAIAETGEPVLNVAEAQALGVDEAHLRATVSEKRRQMEVQQNLYRGGRSLANLSGRTVLLVDDGIATGLTMRAAVAAARAAGASRVAVVVPVGPATTLSRLKSEADEVICPEQPADFWAVGAHYDDFSPVADDEVARLLRDFADRGGGGQDRRQAA